MYLFFLDGSNTFKSERVRHWMVLLEEYDYIFLFTSMKDNIIANMNKNVAMEDDNSEAKEIAPSPGEVLNNLVSYIKTPVEDKHSASPFMVKYNFRAHSQDNNFMVIQN